MDTDNNNDSISIHTTTDSSGHAVSIESYGLVIAAASVPPHLTIAIAAIDALEALREHAVNAERLMIESALIGDDFEPEPSWKDAHPSEAAQELARIRGFLLLGTDDLSEECPTEQLCKLLVNGLRKSRDSEAARLSHVRTILMSGKPSPRTTEEHARNLVELARKATDTIARLTKDVDRLSAQWRTAESELLGIRCMMLAPNPLTIQSATEVCQAKLAEQQALADELARLRAAITRFGYIIPR